jgi:sterol desaturase/sphingolipid hydroxylase (fatty acid hydroxylase superfamily)
MQNLSHALAGLARLLHLGDLAHGTLRAALLLGGIFVAIYLFEAWRGADRTRYRSRHFGNDMAYFLFYQSGLYHLAFGAMLLSALREPLGFLRLEALAGLPAPAHWVIYWVLIDFCDYWLHRFKHHSRLLWAFHAVHHSQEQMTFVTSWRFHPVEQLIASIIMLAPLLVLGVPTVSWLPMVMVMNAFESVQHAQLDWTYGPFYRVLVSPVFHSIHHSTDRAHHDRNYAKIFSAWDFLFGTAVADEPRPLKTGISGMQIEETLAAQLLAPIRLLSGKADSSPRRRLRSPVQHEEPFA